MAHKVIVATLHNILRTFASLNYWWKGSFFPKSETEHAYITLILLERTRTLFTNDNNCRHRCLSWPPVSQRRHLCGPPGTGCLQLHMRRGLHGTALWDRYIQNETNLNLLYRICVFVWIKGNLDNLVMMHHSFYGSLRTHIWLVDYTQTIGIHVHFFSWKCYHANLFSLVTTQRSCICCQCGCIWWCIAHLNIWICNIMKCVLSVWKQPSFFGWEVVSCILCPV